VGDQDGGRSNLRWDRFQRSAQLTRGFGVQGASGHLAAGPLAGSQGARQCQPLLLPAGKLPRHGASKPAKPNQVEQLIAPLAAFSCGCFPDTEAKLTFPHVHILEQA